MLSEVLDGNPLPEQTLCLPPGACARLGKGGITDAALSPDESLIAVASHIGVWLYDTHTGNFSSLIAVAETGVVSAVAFSAENTRLAVGDWDGIVTLWDINTQEKIATFNAEGIVESIVFSPNGKFMAASFQLGGVILWNLTTGKNHLTLLVGMNVDAVTFSTNSQILTTVGHEIPDSVDAVERTNRIDHGEVIVRQWDVATGELCRSFSSKRVSYITSTPSGQLLGASSLDEEVSIWQLDTGKDVTSFSLPAYVHLFGYSVNNLLLCQSGESGYVFTIWSDTEQKDFLLNQPIRGEGWLVTFIPGTKHIVSLDRIGTLRHWDIGSDQRVRLLEEVSRFGSADTWFRGHMLTCFSEEHSLVTSILGYSGTEVVLQNEETCVTFVPEITTPGLPVISAAVSPDLTLFATGGCLDKAITLWNVETEKPIRIMMGHTGEVFDLAFSPDGKHLVSGGARAWEYDEDEDEDGSTFRTDVAYVSVIEDGKSYHFCFGEDCHMDTTAKIWEAATGKCIRTLENHGWVNRIAFSGDGTLLVTSSAKYVNLWCTQTWEKLATIDTVKIESLAFSSDGTLLAIGGTWPEQRIQIWNVITHALVVEFLGHKSDVESVAFSPDGTLLASGSFDGTILLWDLKPCLKNT